VGTAEAEEVAIRGDEGPFPFSFLYFSSCAGFGEVIEPNEVDPLVLSLERAGAAAETDCAIDEEEVGGVARGEEEAATGAETEGRLIEEEPEIEELEETAEGGWKERARCFSVSLKLWLFLSSYTSSWSKCVYSRFSISLVIVISYSFFFCFSSCLSLIYLSLFSSLLFSSLTQCSTCSLFSFLTFDSVVTAAAAEPMDAIVTDRLEGEARGEVGS
jgi:hypothetical protein